VYEREIDRDSTMKILGRMMSDTEYACALSHASVYEHILKNDLAGAVILEDDAIVSASFKRFVQDGHCRKFSMAYLAHGAAYAYNSSKVELFPGSAVWKLRTNPDRTTGYSIQFSVAQKLLREIKPISRPADKWPCDLSDFSAVIAHPSIVYFDDTGPSTISDSLRKQINRKNKNLSKYSRLFTKYYWRIKVIKKPSVHITSSQIKR